ncbi:hypothetical protein [Flavobacterium sp.]|uniref:hypothetical protein n=1 Tax=Flavobacterium sp. TaxID=239 RepID=UPI002CCB83DA|nr:hypothetical protein [Flavobacterium sp.]HSD07019.1 hypothetical protein [Flavobacterium sp.]
MKKLILILSLVFSLQSCSQPNLNKEEMIAEFTKNTPNPSIYNTHPQYRLEQYSSNCRWEIRLNDMLLFLGEMSHTKSGSISNNSFWLNYYILHSGKQIITIKIYPVEGQKTLGEFATFRLIGLDLYPDKTKDKTNYQRLLSWELPDKDVKDLPFLIIKKEFEAVVPYTNVGWEKSKDLTEIKDLDKMVIEKMKDLEEIMKEENGIAHLNLAKNSLQEKYICSYSNSKEIAEDCNDLVSMFTGNNEVEGIEWVPYTNYELVFYGNGRVVSLRRRGDVFNFYGPAYKGKWKDDKSYTEQCFSKFFHIPEGSDKLEIIR